MFFITGALANSDINEDPFLQMLNAIEQEAKRVEHHDGVGEMMEALNQSQNKKPRDKGTFRGVSKQVDPIEQLLFGRQEHPLMHNIIAHGGSNLASGPDNKGKGHHNHVVVRNDPGPFGGLIPFGLFAPEPPRVRVRIVIRRKPEAKETDSLPPEALMQFVMAHILRELPDIMNDNEIRELLGEDSPAVKARREQRSEKPECLILTIGRDAEQSLVKMQEDAGFKVAVKKFATVKEFYEEQPRYDGRFEKIVEVGALVAILHDMEENHQLDDKEHIEGPAAAKIKEFWKRLKRWLKTVDVKAAPGETGFGEDSASVQDLDGSHHDSHIMSVNNMDDKVAEQFQHLAKEMGMFPEEHKQNESGVSSWRWVPRHGDEL
jgi:hypothetical protein